MSFVTDTHPLIWSLFAPKRLSVTAIDLFTRANRGEHIIFIPAVVIAEAIMVVEKGRVKGTVSELLHGLSLLQASGSYQLLDLHPDTVIASHALTVIPDIFDRLVVAEAQRLALPLITRDGSISAAGAVATVWD